MRAFHSPRTHQDGCRTPTGRSKQLMYATHSVTYDSFNNFIAFCFLRMAGRKEFIQMAESFILITVSSFYRDGLGKVVS